MILRLARAGSDLVARSVEVNPGGGDVGMAQHLLDHRQGHAAMKHTGGKTTAQGPRADSMIDTGGISVALIG